MKNEVLKNNTSRMERSARLTAAVAKLLRWAETDCFELQYEQGLAYLNAYLNHDEYSVQVMERSRIFWNWWKNHWTNRDQGFLEFTLNTAYDLKTLRELYLETHDAQMLATSIQPTAVVLNESYANMATELVESEIAKPSHA